MPAYVIVRVQRPARRLAVVGAAALLALLALWPEVGHTQRLPSRGWDDDRGRLAAPGSTAVDSATFHDLAFPDERPPLWPVGAGATLGALAAAIVHTVPQIIALDNKPLDSVFVIKIAAGSALGAVIGANAAGRKPALFPTALGAAIPVIPLSFALSTFETTGVIVLPLFALPIGGAVLGNQYGQ